MEALHTAAFGDTGLTVTQLGFGTALAGAEKPHWTDETADRQLNQVLDAGTNFIDTAYDYVEVERHIGASVYSRYGEFILATKCGCTDTLPSPNASTHKWTRDNLFRGLEISLEREHEEWITRAGDSGGWEVGGPGVLIKKVPRWIDGESTIVEEQRSYTLADDGKKLTVEPPWYYNSGEALTYELKPVVDRSHFQGTWDYGFDARGDSDGVVEGDSVAGTYTFTIDAEECQYTVNETFDDGTTEDWSLAGPCAFDRVEYFFTMEVASAMVDDLWYWEEEQFDGAALRFAVAPTPNTDRISVSTFLWEQDLHFATDLWLDNIRQPYGNYMEMDRVSS